MNVVFLYLMLYFGFLQLLVNCKGNKRKFKSTRAQQNRSSTGNDKKSNSKIEGLEVDKTKDSENTGDKKEGGSDVTQDHRTTSGRADVMHKTQTTTPNDEKISKSKITSGEKSDDHKENAAHLKSKTKTRMTKSEDDSGRKRIYKEAKTQCPERSNSEELNAALRSEMGGTEKSKQKAREPRTIERTQCPERSLMDEMNAALASENASARSVAVVDAKNKIRRAVEGGGGGGGGVLRPANMGIIGNHDWNEVHTCKTEESDR